MKLLVYFVEMEFVELRALLSSMIETELSVAGQAVALSQWHQVHQLEKPHKMKTTT